MKNFILFLGLISIFSCEKEIVQTKNVLTEKQINTIVLTVDTFKYKSDYDTTTISVRSNTEFNMTTEFFFTDSLGKMENLTPIIKENSAKYFIKYEIDDVLGFKINTIDKASNGKPLGLLTNFKTSKNGMGNLKITLFYSETCDTIFVYKFINLARAVYFTNDVRSRVKNKINSLTKSNISEVKSYKKY
jgi:hypothetical protein